MHSEFKSYAAGVARVLLVLLRVALQTVLQYAAARAALLLAIFVGAFVLLVLAHHVQPGPLDSWYASLDKNKAASVSLWRAFDASCSRSFCRYLLPSPIRHYELHIKEETRLCPIHRCAQGRKRKIACAEKSTACGLLRARFLTRPRRLLPCPQRLTGIVFDIQSTGQNMHILSQAADILSPMLYPSHFGLSFGGIENHADKPALFLEEGVQRLRAIAPDRIIRPWIQTFRWRVSNYSPRYISEQIRGAKKAGGQGYLLWNAGNVYERFAVP